MLQVTISKKLPHSNKANHKPTIPKQACIPDVLTLQACRQWARLAGWEGLLNTPRLTCSVLLRSM